MTPGGLSELWRFAQTPIKVPSGIRYNNEVLLPDESHFKVVVIRHTDEVWPDDWHAAVPSECSDEAKSWTTKKDIVQHLALIPTLFKFNSLCDRALLEKAALLRVQRNAGRIEDFLHGR